MPRQPRIEYEGAIYHLLSRGDRREEIVVDAEDRHRFVQALGAVCAKCDWEVHAWVLMRNHFHLVIETPQPNLVAGIRWLLGTYTQRFNRRHGLWGHLFGGRYKAQLIDDRDAFYLVAACNYVHLNPARAGLIATGKRLEAFVWSSYPSYLSPRIRPSWLRIDRVFGEHGLQKDTASARREFARRMAQLCPVDLAGEYGLLRRGWKLGGEDFVDRLADKLARRGHPGERAGERRETDQALAERLVRLGLKEAGWNESDLKRNAKGHRTKVSLACRLRGQTPMTRNWIAKRLQMGSASYLSNLLGECR